ncbi:FRIGIDA-like protein 5 [Linum grandiflorum]
MKKEIELLESEKAVFKKKLQELEEKEEEFETLGSYVEERAIQVRKTEEQMEDQRKEIEECFRRFEEQSVAFNLIQSEFQVRLSELAARENQLKEIESKLVKRIEEVGLREKLLEEKEKEVESKQSEFQVLKRDLELKEKQVVDHSSTANFRICVTMNGKDLQIFLNERSKDGSDLMKDEAKAALKLSSEPAKLVLDAMEGFYPPHLKKGDVEFEEGVIRNSCLMLLEELTRMSPEIKPTVRKEAMKVACDWMSRMKCDADHSIEVLALLQLMAAFGLASSFDDDELVPRVRVIAHYSQAPRLLQDLGLANKISGVIQKLIEKEHHDEACMLVSAFELHNEFPSVSPCSKEDEESNVAPFIGNAVLLTSDTGPITPDRLLPSPAQCKRSSTDACTDVDHANLPSQELEMSNLPDEETESLTSDQAGCTDPLSEIQLSEVEIEKGSSLFIPECLEKGGTTLQSLCWKIEREKLHCSEVDVCLQLVSDQAEFVLGVVKNPSSFKWKKGDEQVRFASPEHGPLLLLDRMWRMAPHISQNTQREALSFAAEWKPKLIAASQMKDNHMELVSFVLFLAAYKLDSSAFDLHELFSLFRTSHWCLNLTKLFRALGFKDLVSKFIDYLMRNRLPRQGLQCINLSNLLEKAPSIRDIIEELELLKAFLKPVEDVNLVQSFRARISFLEKRKEKIRAEKNHEAIATSEAAEAVPCTASNSATSSSTAPRPQEKRGNKRRKLASTTPVRKFHPPQQPLQFTGTPLVVLPAAVVPVAVAPDGIIFQHLPPPPPGPYPNHSR